MKKNTIFIILITLLALFLRILFLDKPEGLWNDEYMAWRIASTDLHSGFFNAMFNNCHLPLYYLLLKGWMFLFGQEDFVLRFSSVFVGMLNVISMYFLGKEFNNKITGLICATFATLSSFLIYFSQEVRLYGLIFLFSIWIAFFFSKSLKNPSKTNLALYLLSNFLLLITHTIAFVFVFFNLVIFSTLITKNNPNFKKPILLFYTILILAITPFLPHLATILTRDNLSQNWSDLNFSKILFNFTDYFTPILLNITNSPKNLLIWAKNTPLLSVILCFILPLLISAFAITKALLHKNNKLNTLILISFLYFLTLITASALGKLVLSTKYSIEIFPTLILAFAYGISTLNSKKSKITTLSVYFIICLSYLLFAPNAPQKLPRPEGHRLPAIILQQQNIAQNDYIISLYHQFFRYEKYTKFTPKHLTNIDKLTLAKYLISNSATEQDLKHKGKTLLRKDFLLQNNPNINKKFDNIFSEIPKNSKIAIIIPNQVTFLDEKSLTQVAAIDNKYNKIPIMFTAFSYAKIELLKSAKKYCGTATSTNQYGSWLIVTYTKK